MRVIHHDGRVGTIIHRHPCHGYVTVRFDGRDIGTVFESNLRPIGPIEEELRRDVGVPWSDLTVDWASEALEACARIWEQHGVAL